jgi:hypothetical protein
MAHGNMWESLQHYPKSMWSTQCKSEQILPPYINNFKKFAYTHKNKCKIVDASNPQLAKPDIKGLLYIKSYTDKENSMKTILCKIKQRLSSAS